MELVKECVSQSTMYFSEIKLQDASTTLANFNLVSVLSIGHVPDMSNMMHIVL